MAEYGPGGGWSLAIKGVPGLKNARRNLACLLRLQLVENRVPRE